MINAMSKLQRRFCSTKLCQSISYLSILTSHLIIMTCSVISKVILNYEKRKTHIRYFLIEYVQATAISGNLTKRALCKKTQ